jgi:periplasmic protein CpxP/Spy
MDMPSSNFFHAFALAILLIPAAGFAQSTPPTAPIPPSTTPAAATPPAQPAAAPPLSAASQAAVDQRIRTLQSELGITETEMPLWSAFAQAMRESAAATESLFTQRADGVGTMSATENMHSYARIVRAFADDTERLATAFDSLYASLSDTQKRAADTLFRQQASTAAQAHARR